MTEGNNSDFFIKFKQNCKTYSNKLAIISNNEEVSYQVYYEKVQLFQGFLKKNIFSNQKLIAVEFVNSVDSIAIFMAIILNNKIPVLIDPNWSYNQLESILEKYNISCFFVTKSFNSHSYFIDNFEKLTYSERLFLFRRELKAQVNIKNNPLFVGFTSGTTSLPKAFSINQSAWDKSFVASSDIFKLDANSVILTLGQICHGLIFYPIIESLVNGSTAIINLKFERDYFLNYINKFDNISLVLPPIMIEKIYNEFSGLLKNKSIQQVITAGSSIDRRFLKNCFSLFPNCYITEYYGASEIGFVGYRKIEKDRFHKLESFSTFPGVSIKFVESGIAPDYIIWVKSPYLSNGYISNHKEGFQKINNWASVGDRVIPVSDDSFFLKGRTGDMVISGGKNVYLSEIKDFFKSNECIEDVAIFSINDEYWGDKICAVIFMKKGKKIYTNQLKSEFMKHHEAYKFPKQIFVSKEMLPLTSSGKINIGKLKNSVLERKKNILIEL